MVNVKQRTAPSEGLKGKIQNGNEIFLRINQSLPGTSPVGTSKNERTSKSIYILVYIIRKRERERSIGRDGRKYREGDTGGLPVGGHTDVQMKFLVTFRNVHSTVWY